ncbi:hypothetical protein Y1Q_0002400 [Alligator mississippiensis]|uniref:Uncharacterized protein n=1 Tax=Alligator mississippiensis TaxID=8496 RepID=A0A151MM10_ALLMI|nr:hypothetical protein Y1Q_0002400 [Alligator mississippiensis]
MFSFTCLSEISSWSMMCPWDGSSGNILAPGNMPHPRSSCISAAGEGAQAWPDLTAPAHFGGGSPPPPQLHAHSKGPPRSKPAAGLGESMGPAWGVHPSGAADEMAPP